MIETLSTLGKAQLPAQLARWLDALDETGRWALLKLVTGGLRIGVSARLAKTAAASLGGKEPNEIEMLWPGLAPPYAELFAWLEGRAEMPVTRDPAPFRPAMLAHAHRGRPTSPRSIRATSWPSGNGTASACRRSPARATTAARVTRLYSRTGEDISKSFPDLVEALRLPGAIDGELLIVRDGRVQSFNVLQQRLNRKAVTPKLLHGVSRRICAPTICWSTAPRICATCRSPSGARGCEAFVAELDDPRDRPLAADCRSTPGRR